MVAVIAVKVVSVTFNTLVVPQRKSMVGYALHLCRGNKAQAEDICQEALIRAMEAWDNLKIPPASDPEKIVRAWLFTITYNCFVNSWRRGKRNRDAVENFRHQLVEATYGTTFEYNGADPREEMEAQGYSDEVVAALDALDKDQRKVVELSTAGKAYKEIAQELDIPIGTVMSRLCRARRKLEAQLGDYAGLNYGLRRGGDDVEDPAPLEPAESPETDADSIDGVMGGDDADALLDGEALVDPEATW